MSKRQPSTVSAPPPRKRRHVAEAIWLVELIARHEQLAELCDRLEACADALPGRPHRAELEQLCRDLGDVIDDEVVGRAAATAMVGPDAGDPLASALLRHVASCNIADQVHAHDLIAELRAEPAGDRRAAAETLGYMLRCFFTARRRTLAFEALAALALGERRLTPGGRSMLVDSLYRRIA